MTLSISPFREKPRQEFGFFFASPSLTRSWEALGSRIWARKRSRRHEGAPPPSGGTARLVVRPAPVQVPFHNPNFLLSDQGGEAFPTIPGFLIRPWIPHPGQERSEQQAGAEPGSPPSPCRGISAQSRACRSASSSQRHSRNAKKQAPLFHLEPPSSPRRFLGFFRRFFCLRTCSSGSAAGARGGQVRRRALQEEDSKCTRRVPRG